MFEIDLSKWWQQTGWECPKCGRVYSPWTPMCYTCGMVEIKTGDTTNPLPDTNSTSQEPYPWRFTDKTAE